MCRKMIGNNSKEPLLTVVVPVYNGEKYIKNTIDTILNSKYSNLELLLVDDGSTDESGTICQSYRKDDERVCYVKTENLGIVEARNKGLELANGEYICFCDQDDIVEPFMYREILEKMFSESAQMGMCSTGKMMDGKKSIYEKLENGVYKEEEVLEYLLFPLLFRGFDYSFVKNNNYLYGTIWKCIFNRSFLTEQQIKFRSFVNFEDDWLFVTETLAAANKVITVSNAGYYWRINRNSKSHKPQFIPDMMQRFEKMDEYVFRYLEKRKITNDILKEYKKAAMCEHYAEGYKNALWSGKYKRKYKIELREYLLKTNYKTNLTCAKKLKSSAFRRKMLYTSLGCIGIKGTFVVNRILVWMEENAGKIQWVTALERKSKMKA